MKNYLTHSLKRLGLDYVDLYQPCRIDLGIPVEETIGAISRLVEEGFVRNIGISEVDAETLEKANAVHPISRVEMDYSLINRRIESDIILQPENSVSILLPLEYLQGEDLKK